MILRNFVVFEGIDGTGTTTQLARLKERYRESLHTENIPAVFTCEPTDGEIGKLIRKALKGDFAYTADTMARLFAADRGEHIFGKGGIGELTREGTAVFSDRYFFSSLAYQGEAGDGELPLKLNGEFPLPEYLFYFDIDPDIAMDRVEKRAGTLEIYEKRAFQKKVRARYLEIVAGYERTDPDMTIIRIDATRSIEEIADIIWSIAKNLPKIGV
jgi:dTMP kinase